MGEREDRIKKLAKSLYESGFSISESIALEKAREMTEIEEKIKDAQQKKGLFGRVREKLIAKKDEAPVKLGNYDSDDNKTVNEIMEEAGISSEEIAGSKERKKEELGKEVDELKKEIEGEKKEQHPDRIKEIKEREDNLKRDIEILEEEEGERIDIE